MKNTSLKKYNMRNRYHAIIEDLLSQAGIIINGSNEFDIKVHNDLFYKRVVLEGTLGLGESYMDGWWDCERIDIFIKKILIAKLDEQVTKNLKELVRIIYAKVFNLQTKKRSWIVGEKHYDLGNNLFEIMLDPQMQYSCGYWKNVNTLEDAQIEKLKMICEKLELKKGMSLLDIGCGWGGLAEFAAKNYGVSVCGLTISAEQQKFSQQRCAGLDVEIILQDYRSFNRRFDRIVSVGMFEHVGQKNYEEYFNFIDKNLTPNGIFLLHTIGSNKTDENVDAWINKYIFPNGCLPSISQIAKSSEAHLIMEDWHNFGADYDKTLMAWSKKLNDSWYRLDTDYDERFKRMFTYYLNICAGAFRARNIQLWQIVFTRGLEGGLRVIR